MKLGAGTDRVREPRAIGEVPAVDEDGHVLAQRAALVDDVAAEPGISREDRVEHLAHRGARDLDGRRMHVPLQVRRERHHRHEREDYRDLAVIVSGGVNFGSSRCPECNNVTVSPPRPS